MSGYKRKFSTTTWLWVIGVGLVFSIWAGSWFLMLVPYSGFKSWSDRGSFGDMFGAVNSLFAGLAFVAVVITVHLQSKALVETRRDVERAAFEGKFHVYLNRSVSFSLYLIAFSLLLCRADLLSQKRSPQDTTMTKRRAIAARESKLAELALPDYQRKMGPALRALVQKMHAEGDARDNAQWHSDVGLYRVDTLGRIFMLLSVIDLQCNAIEELEDCGVIIHSYATREGLLDKAAVDYLKQAGVEIVDAYPRGNGSLGCSVPFDVVEDVARMKAVRKIDSPGIWVH